MGTLIWLVIIGAVVYYVVIRPKSQKAPKLTSTPSRSSSRSKGTRASRVFEENEEWLEEKWQAIEEAQASGDTSAYPDWYFDDMTERQEDRLESEGIEVRSRKVTKGMASDLIGLFEPPEDDELEILKHFKVPLKGMNQSKARYLSAKLMSDPANVESFRNRPADADQKEFYKFFGLPIPKGLKWSEAQDFIQKKTQELSPEQRQEWDDYESLWLEFEDADFRETYGIKKVSHSLFKQAVEKARNDGHSLGQLSDDPEILVDILFEMRPELEREL